MSQIKMAATTTSNHLYLQTQTTPIRNRLIGKRFFDQLETQILRYPRASREYAEMKALHQKRKRAEAEKKILEQRDHHIQHAEDREQLRHQVRLEQGRTAQEVVKHQETRTALDRVMAELALKYQKEGHDWKYSWVLTFQDAQLWRELSTFMDEHQGIEWRAGSQRKDQ